MLTPVHIRHRNRLQEAVDVGVLLGRGSQQLEAKLSLRVLLGGKMLMRAHLHRYVRFHLFAHKLDEPDFRYKLIM